MVNNTENSSRNAGIPATSHAKASSDTQLEPYPALPLTSASTSVDPDEGSSRSSAGSAGGRDSPSPGAHEEDEGPTQDQPKDLTARLAALIERSHVEQAASEKMQAEFDKVTDGLKEEIRMLRSELNAVNDDKSRIHVEKCSLQDAINHTEKRSMALREEVQMLKQQLLSETGNRIALEHAKNDALKQKAILESAYQNERALSKKEEAEITALDKEVSSLQQALVQERTRRVCLENQMVGMKDELDLYERDFGVRNAAETIRNNVLGATASQINNSSVLDADAMDAIQIEVKDKTDQMFDGLTEDYNFELRNLQSTIAEKEKLLKEIREDRDRKKDQIAKIEREYRLLRDKFERLEQEYTENHEKYLRDMDARAEEAKQEREQHALQIQQYANLLKEQQSKQVTMKLLEEIIVTQEKKDESKALVATSSPANSIGGGAKHRQAIKRKEAPGDASFSASSSNASPPTAPALGSSTNVNNNNSKRVRPANHVPAGSSINNSSLLVSPARQPRNAHAGVTPLRARLDRSPPKKDDAGCLIM